MRAKTQIGIIGCGNISTRHLEKCGKFEKLGSTMERPEPFPENLAFGQVTPY